MSHDDLPVTIPLVALDGPELCATCGHRWHGLSCSTMCRSEFTGLAGPCMCPTSWVEPSDTPKVSRDRDTTDTREESA